LRKFARQEPALDALFKAWEDPNRPRAEQDKPDKRDVQLEELRKTAKDRLLDVRNAKGNEAQAKADTAAAKALRDFEDALRKR
jgi:hypothetical protein